MKILASFLMVLVSVAVALGLGEGYLWFDDNWGRAPEVPTEVTWNGNSYTLNEPPQMAAGGKDRWLVIGDSFVVGRACGAERNLTGHLRAIAAAEKTLPMAINLGQPGRSGPTYDQIFADFVAEFGPPRRATIVLYANDPDFDPGICRQLPAYRSIIDQHPLEAEKLYRACEAVDTETFQTGLIDRLLQQFYTAKLLRETAMRFLLLTGREVSLGRVKHLADWLRPDSLYRHVLYASLERSVATARQNGITLDIVFYPPVDDLSYESPYYDVYERVAADLTRVLGLPVASGYAAFPLVKGKKLAYGWSIADHHPSCEGHALMARWLAERARATIAAPAGNDTAGRTAQPAR